eukprot:767683-Hanusia_phi.AAC.4
MPEDVAELVEPDEPVKPCCCRSAGRFREQVERGEERPRSAMTPSSSVVTHPLDVVKTRFQVRRRRGGGGKRRGKVEGKRECKTESPALCPSTRAHSMYGLKKEEERRRRRARRGEPGEGEGRRWGGEDDEVVPVTCGAGAGDYREDGGSHNAVSMKSAGVCGLTRC